jgi:hypothetical protein
MNDAERRFAERLAEDLDRVLGAGFVVSDIELVEGQEGVTARATILVEGRVETIEAEAPTVDGLARPVVERIAEIRRDAAFWRSLGPT